MTDRGVARSQRHRARVLAVAAAALALGVLISACAASQVQPDEAKRAAAEEAWGIRVLQVALSGGGGLVDLRYQVTDVEKAAVALGASAHGHDTLTVEDIKNSPQLVDQATGIALLEAQIHFMGRVQTQRVNPKAGISRFILFSNTNGLIKRGSQVSLAIGDVRIEELVVQ